MNKIFIQNATEACTRRSLDAKKLKTYFLKNDYKIVSDPAEADHIIIITCAVRELTEQKSVEEINRFKRYKARMIVTGCLPGINKEKLDKNFKGISIIAKDLDEIDKYFSHKISFSEISDGQDIAEFHHESKSRELERNPSLRQDFQKFIKKFELNKSFFDKMKEYINKNYFNINQKQYYLRVSQGCIWNCSYCSIRKSIGKLRSNPLDRCLADLKLGLKKGYNHFIVIADDLGAYGQDINTNIAELLDKMTSLEGNFKLDITEFHPYWILKYRKQLSELLDKKKIICLQSALQSGNKRVLKLMRRPGEIEDIKSILKSIRTEHPDIVLHTHIIAGFPTETREEFMDSLKALIEVDFSWGEIYRYTDRPGTDSYRLKQKISEEEKKSRMNIAKEFLMNNGYDVTFTENGHILVFLKQAS